MIILGLILLLVGYLVGIHALTVIGVVLIAVGLVLMLVGTAGPVGGRWW